MYLVKSPWWLKRLYSKLTWDLPAEEKAIYLTFDDGPHPVATPFVLDTLQDFNAKATFFCIGKNVRAQPAIYRRIADEGHAIGNHTNNHLNGWKTGDDVYLKDVMEARKYIDSSLFRPPYGRISRFQIQQLEPTFEIVMWDVLSGDFDEKLTPKKSLDYVIANTKPGSIVVFHDSEKAFERMKYALPRMLEHFTEKGFLFKHIRRDALKKRGPG